MKATGTLPNEKAHECRKRLCNALKKGVCVHAGQDEQNNGNTKTKSKCALILSGGVDTCAILEAASEIGLVFDVGITVVIGDDSPDEAFATYAAAEKGLKHHIVRMSSDDLVKKYLPRTVELLQTWDGMTLRNSLVISAAFEKASDLGMQHVVVGDGADELFGGYSFMWGMEDDTAQWKEKRDIMCQEWTFATKELASSYGVCSNAPYCEPDFVQWALTTTQRSDCICERPIKLRLDSIPIMHQVGKVILREAFETCASWRRKDPIEVGSGATIISKDEYWFEQLPDEEYKQERETLLRQGVVIKSKEHLMNFRAYIQIFGLTHPHKERLPLGEGCAGCCFALESGKNFCHLCGAWPAQREP